MRVDLENFIFDNPLFIKHVRSRLRKGQAVPVGVVVVVLCLLLIWLGYLHNGFADGSIFSMTIGLQSIVLVIIGASQVASSAGGVRETGILDFHRISPVPETVITAGFFLGAPIREYVLAALTLPLSAYCASQGKPGLGEWVQIQIALVLVAWVFHGTALLTALMAKKPKSSAMGMLAFLVMVFMYASGGIMSVVWGAVPRPDFRFFGLELPWLAFSALYLVSALVFLLAASTRKMRSDRAHALSKPQAVAFLSTVAVLMVGGAWSFDDKEAVPLMVLYGLVLASLPAMVTVTPEAGEFARGLRRASRAGRTSLSAWDDLSLNRLTVVLLCLIVFTGASVAAEVLKPAPQLGPIDPLRGIYLAIAVGVLVAAYFGLAYQFFALSEPKRPGTFMGLFLFFAWIVPMLAAGIASLSSMDEKVVASLASISPVSGLALASGWSPRDDLLRVAQVSALLPAAGFAFVFNNLVSVYRRRIRRATLGPGGPAPKPEPLDPFLVER